MRAFFCLFVCIPLALSYFSVERESELSEQIKRDDLPVSAQSLFNSSLKHY